MEGLPCDCCTPGAPPTPRPTESRAGLPALARRVGTHGTFKRAMHRAVDGYAHLRKLSARDDAEPAMALIDAWATALDVLTFYQERIANEGYLRTATERRSLQQLGAGIGYRLRPATAAIADVAFTVDETKGAADEVRLDPGTRVQSQPAQDELPQTFETVERLLATRAWNSVPPRRTRITVPGPGDVSAVFADPPVDLKPGDLLLFVGDLSAGEEENEFALRRVTAVGREADRPEATVRWNGGLPTAVTTARLRVFVLRVKASLFGFNAANPALFSAATQDALHVTTQWNDKPVTGAAVNLDAVYSGVAPGSWVVLRGGQGPTISLFRARGVQETVDTRFALAGRVTRIALDRAVQAGAFTPRDTTVLTLSEGLRLADAPFAEPVTGAVIDLALPRPQLAPGKRLIVEGALAHSVEVTVEDPKPNESVDEPDAPPPTALPVGPVTPSGRARTGRILIGDISSQPVRALLSLSTRAVGALGRAAELGTQAAAHTARVPVPAPADAPRFAEVVTVLVHEVEEAGPGRVVLLSPLTRSYDRASTTLYGNVARTSHGESHDDVIGSGDASTPFQAFTLPAKPLTYLPGTGERAADPAIEIRVNGVTWEGRESLYGSGREERVYEVSETAEGTSVVGFGDGRTSGARLPSGVENVRAIYRSGSGPLGRVKANQLSILMTRPLGLYGAINPMPAEGGTDAESIADARANVPSSVLTLGRVVSVQDYADFASAYPGVGRASARLLWQGERQVIHLTVAGEGGVDLGESPGIVATLWAALERVRDPHQHAVLQPCTVVRVSLHLAVLPQVGRQFGDVATAVKGALVGAFGVAARELEAALTGAEVEAVAQRADGVEAVSVLSMTPPPVGDRIPARPARIEGGLFGPADLLLVDAAHVTSEEMSRAR